MSKINLIVENIIIPKRIDAYLASALAHEFSRSQIKAALLGGKIALNGKSAAPKTLVKTGDVIEAQLVSEPAYKPSPEKTALTVVYEDADILVIDKPAGMVVHPGAGNKQGTLVNALLGRGGNLSTVGGDIRPGIVHRLDKETSGLLLVAKNNKAHVALQQQFQEHSLSKTYIALVKGKVEFNEGRIEAPIGRHPKIRLKMAVVSGDEGKEAFTQYRVLKRLPHATLLEIKLLTGRTHQIRVHMAHLGYPVIGDALYGTMVPGMRRHALHASKIEFKHPKSGKLIHFESPIPPDFEQMIENEKHKN